MNVPGEIVKYDGNRLCIVAPFSDTEFLTKKRVERCTVVLDDGRTITAQQRKYIYAMLNDIAAHTGHVSDELKDHFKLETLEKTGGNWFSLSDCSMTEANQMIETIIEFCIRWRIPTRDDLATFAPDIEQYMYLCLKHKVCCISRREGAELHHVDHVGIGRKRKEILHLGMRAMPLLQKYHCEVHRIGQKTFNEKYHVFGIPLTQELCEIWKLKGG